MAIKIDISQYITRHARGLHANYNALIAEEGIQKDGVIYYCTDTTGAYQGCIIYNGITYGQGNGGVTSINAEQDTKGIKVTLTFKDNTTKDFTIAKASTSTYGVVKTTNSISGDNTDQALVPTYSVVKALDAAKAPLASPNFSGTPKIDDVEIATKNDVTSAIAANDAMRYKGTLGTGADFTALPNISNTAVKNGDTYKIVTAGRYNGTTTAKVGDMYIANKDPKTNTGTWDYVPSGNEDETYIQIGERGDIKSGVVRLGTVVTKNIVPSEANATDTDDSLVPTEKRVQGKIDALKTSIDSKVKSVTSNTLEVSNTQQDITVELPEVGTAGTKGGMGSAQTPDFGTTVSIAGVVVDAHGRVTGGGQPHSLTFPSRVASIDKAGLMSKEDKINLDNVVKALLWIDITNS